ncbi:MAG: NAD(P)-dependent oxidoreductase [Deltaproteobacteria bacterium]|uniref:NAD(P)-dependent oxidoreductase n=1 Tax=Candidatus Zymogenus saltonus TaxID=2844893 RepID=A0A9D8KFD6_9DELT|nr:NAD(P)-dependent oxidoreductase [Candidatus Zymogenus saltonus]
MNILVTGGAGYVGSTLVPLLLFSGHRVRVLDLLQHGGDSLLGVWSHPGFEFLYGDICDGKIIERGLSGMDAVVHLAAIVGDPACARKKELAKAINIDASLSLIDAANEGEISRFIFASTCSNYGKMKDPNRLVDETSELSPVSLYAETKVAIEKALLDSADSNGFCPVLLRLATVFGVSPRMRFDLTVNEFAMEMYVKKHLVVYGEQFWRPYIHVRDAARAILSVLKSGEEKVKGEVFNVGSSGENYQKQQLVELILPYAPDAIVEYVHKDEDPRDYRVSFEKIKNRLGFTVEHTVKDGIEEIIGLAKDNIIKDYLREEYRN